MIHKSTIEASAELTDDGYRYWLKRVWDANKRIGVFIALNPSKATELKCDPTMCNMNNLSLQWGWGGFYILNLFAYMSTDKDKLKTIDNTIGDDNDMHIVSICKEHDPIILSWGEEKPLYVRKRADAVRLLLRELKKDVYCLAENQTSGYKHPLIIKIEDYKQPLKISI